MKYFIFIVFILNSLNTYADEKLELTLETGTAWQFRNDVNIPNENNNSRFDFSNFRNGPFFHHRIESLFKLTGRHNLRLVYAPLSLSVKGGLNKDINFNDVAFSSSQDVRVNYKFNSYRLGYVYNWLKKTKHKLNVGLTIKMREADIRVSQGTLSTNYDNIGLVPLLYFSYQYNLTEDWFLFTNADFAASSQGRAFDYTLKVRKKLNDNYFLSLGYRVLEGGADTDEVFTFSLFHYAVLDLHLAF